MLLFPLDFEEFLGASGDGVTIPYLQQAFNELKPLGNLLKPVMDKYRTYMLVGGMPQAVLAHIDMGNIDEVERRKREIIRIYREDIAKYVENYIAQATAVFNSIPSQLAHHDKKLKYSALGAGDRYRSNSDAIYSRESTWSRLIMELLLGFIAGYINQIIVAVGIGVLSGLVICGVVFTNKKHELQDMLDGGRVRTVVNPSTLESRQERYATLTREDTDIKRQGFNRWCSFYLVLTQLISVLPLLGILGTVAGLIMEVRAGDLEAILNSLDTALYSTLFALFFAIVLKFVDSCSTSRLIYNIETIFDDYDRRFRDAIDMGRFNE